MPQLQAPPGPYRYRLEFWDQAGQRVHELALGSADFARAVEAAFFDGLRKGIYSHYDPPLGRALMEPRFADPDGASPRAAGFTVVLPAPDGREHRADFDADFFQRRASHLGADLVRAGRVPNGSTLLFRLAAYLDGADEAPRRGPKIVLEPASVELPVRPGSRTDFGKTEAWDGPRPEDLPVLVPRWVLEEAVEEARRDPEREVGGVLLGHLRRDPASGEVFLEITCQVPAEQTQATAASVTFTAATWGRAREVVEHRGEGELIAGWVHSHPFRFCAECPLPTPPECIAKVLFYSEDDEFLMELSFPRPFMVGLLTAVEPKLEQALGHLPVRLYGWRDGAITARGFHVLEG